MKMWESVPLKNIAVPVMHIQIGLGNDVLRNFIYLFDYDVEKLSTGEEVSRNALVTVNQLVSKRRQD